MKWISPKRVQSQRSKSHYDTWLLTSEPLFFFFFFLMQDDWKTLSKRFKWVWLTCQIDPSLSFLLLLWICSWKMLPCRHFKFCTSRVLSYHNFINRRFLRKLTSCVGLKGGEYDNMPWCSNCILTSTSDQFLRHISCRIEFRQHPGELRVTQSTHGTMFVSSLCLYLETGKVCRSKSLRKAALIPSSVASTWDGCKWTNGNQSPFIPPSLHRLPQTKAERCSAGS